MSEGRRRYGLMSLLLVVALLGSAFLANAADAKYTKAQKRAISHRLMRAVKKNPRVVTRRWFLKKASIVDFALPATIRLTPATDQHGNSVSNNVTNNTATLDLGPSLGQRTVGLTGQLHASINFNDAFDGGHLGDVRISLPADASRLSTTSVGLLINPNTSTAAAGQDEKDLIQENGATSGTFVVHWTDPTATLHSVTLNAADTDTNDTIAMQTSIGGNDVFVKTVGAGPTKAVIFSGKYSYTNVGALSLFSDSTAGGTGVAVVSPFVDGAASAGGCSGFTGVAPTDVDLLSNMDATGSLDPGLNNTGPTSQWSTLNDANANSQQDIVLRTGPLSLGVDPVGTATVPGDSTGGGSGVVSRLVGPSGGRANLFGFPVNGLNLGNSVDVTVNLSTNINSIAREVDGGFPGPAGQPDETNGNIAAYFDCRQAWTGYITNHLGNIHLTGSLAISPAITADGKLRIAKVSLSTPYPAKEALAACLAPYALFTAGNPAIGDAAYTAGANAGNPIGPNLIGGSPTSGAFSPFIAVNFLANASAPNYACNSTLGPLNRNPFNVNPVGGTTLAGMLGSGAAVGVSADLNTTIKAEVLVGTY